MATVTRDSTEASDTRRAIFICAVILLGLALDQKVPFWGQTLVSAWLCAILLHWIRSGTRDEQIMLVSCVIYATLGEGFLSLVWGLYDYRLENVPAFVPPGHALLLTLGVIVAARLRDWIVWFVPLAATPFVLWLALTGVDSLGALLFAVLIICIIFSRSRKLYAVMFMLSLAMEIYGTWLGNWAWREEVPWLGLTTTNPPLAAGVFYCLLDFLVMTTLRRWNTRRALQPHSPKLAEQLK